MADILIVDDNQNVLAELKALLNSLAPNLSIVATDSGRKGLSLARSRHPGIILLDINMPSFTGYDVLYELQKAPDTATIPVIFLTGIFLSPEDRIRGLELGAAAYLTKPIDEAELLATIRNLLRLREMEKSLQKEREKLELKVSQRTAELKASRDAWHATFESISDWITIIDMKTRKVLQTNSAVKKMFGHTPQSIIGKPCCGIIHGTDKPVSDCPYCDVKRSGKTSRSRFKHYKSHRWFETTVEPLPAKKGQPQMAVHIVRDVTTQVVNQLAMEESERRFRIFFENQSTYCYMVSTDGIILAANRAAARVLGRKTSELVGTPVKEIYAPESQEQFQKNWAKWLKTGRLDNREMVIQARNGERRIVMLSARAIRDRDGKIMNSVSVQTDITEVKIMEERFHAIFDSSMDAIAVSLEGNIQFVNPACKKLFGFRSNKSVLGRSVLDFIAPADRERIKTVLADRPYLTKRMTQYEVQGIKKDNSIIDLDARITTYEQSGMVYVVSVLRDITESKRMIKALKESEEKFRLAFTTSPDAININRLSDGMYVEINEGFTQITGFTRDDCIGKTSAEINIWARMDDRDRLVQGLKKHGRVENLQAEFRMKNGNIVTGLMSATIITLQGEPHILSITRSIQDRIEARKALESSEEKFRTITEYTTVGVYIIQDRRFVYTNPVFERITGYTLDQLQDKDFYELVDPPDRARVKKRGLARIKGEDVPDHYSFKIRLPDGSRRWVDLFATLIDYQGRPAIIGSILDITEKKRSEEIQTVLNEKLENQIKLTSTILETALDGYILADKKGRIKDVNPSYCQLSGFTRTELLKMTFADLEALEDKQAVADRIKAMLPSGSQRFYTQHYRKDRSRIDLDVNVSIIDIPGGPFIAAFVRDITQVLQDRAAVDESEAKFRNIAEYSANAIFIVQDNCYVYINPGFTQITGYKFDDLGDKQFFDIIHPEDRELVKKRGIARQKGKKVVNYYSFKIITKKGETRYVDFFANYIDYKGRPAVIGSAYDITEQHETTQALKQSEERFRHTFASAGVGRCIFALDGRLIEVNEAFCHLAGRSEKEILSMAWKDLVYTPDISRAEEYIRELFDGTRDCIRYEYRMLNQHGQPFWVDLTVVLVRDAAGQPEYMMADVISIEERKKAELTLKRANQKLRNTIKLLNLLYQSSRDIFTGSIKEMSETVVRLLEQITHYDYGVVMLINEKKTHLVTEAMSFTAREEMGIKTEKALHGMRVPLKKGIVGWVVTNRKTVRCNDVRKNKDYLAVREDIGSELCVPIQTDEEVYGVLNIETRKKRAYSPQDQRVMETLASHLAVAIQTRKYLEQLKNINVELEKRVASRTASLQEERKKLKASNTAMATLIEQLNSSQSRLEETNRTLRRVNEELESFAYSVSHDLRAPLRAVDGFAGMLVEDYGDQLDSEGRRLISVIRNNAQKMGQLIDDLLTLSRLGRKELMQIPVCIKEIVDQAARTVQSHYPEIKIQVIKRKLPYLKIDPILMQQVFVNLISNAVKFRQEDQFCRITVSYSHKNDNHIIRFRDKGIGFDQRYRKKIFEVFQRLYTEEKYPGTGIGLSIVQRVMERHGGHAEAKGTPGKGATFYLYLPNAASAGEGKHVTEV